MSLLNMTLGEVKEFLGEGRIVGDPQFQCRTIGSLGKAGADGISFMRDASFSDEAKSSGVGALLLSEEASEIKCHQLILPEPYQAFGRLLQRIALEKRKHRAGIHPSATVHPGADVSSSATIGPGAVVQEGAQVGPDTVLGANVYLGERSALGRECIVHANVVIMEDVHIGNRVAVHSGTVIGADGFGVIPHPNGHIKIPHVGAVRIGDDVEIGALTTIDRATVDETVIGRGTKIGDMCHIGHNCQVGEDVLMLPRSAIAGSVTLGDRVIMAGRSGSSDNITIGEGAMVGGASCTFEDVAPGSQVWGNPAREKDLEFRIQALLRRLPEMRTELRMLLKHQKANGE